MRLSLDFMKKRTLGNAYYLGIISVGFFMPFQTGLMPTNMSICSHTESN